MNIFTHTSNYIDKNSGKLYNKVLCLFNIINIVRGNIMDCIFCKIAEKKLPSEIVYEDDKVLVFKDLEPKAPVHVLVIPKMHISSIMDLNEDNVEILSHILKVIKKIQTKLNLQDGFRVINNCGKFGGQTVNHIHFHVLGGRQLEWNPS